MSQVNDADARLESDIENYVNDCVKDYAGHVNDSEIARVLRNVADRYEVEGGEK